jgi:hypothetical protein
MRDSYNILLCITKRVEPWSVISAPFLPFGFILLSLCDIFASGLIILNKSSKDASLSESWIIRACRSSLTHPSAAINPSK